MRYLQRGVTVHDRDRATPGLTLFTPLYQSTVYLIDMAGDVAHRWTLPERPANYAYLLANGNLLAAWWSAGRGPRLPGMGGVIQEIDWDGNVVWEHRDDFQHHDFRRCENGNTVYLGWEPMPSEATARVQGGQADDESAEMTWGDYVREVDAAGETVWEWRHWEHMEIERYPLWPDATRHEYAHPNTVVPLPDGNVMVCFRVIDLVAVIDRESGAFAWERREPDWGGPHDFQVLENGNFMVFANRNNRNPRGSKVIEFDRDSGEAVWTYEGNPSQSFESHFISGCQRLSSGNTLICEGSWGRIFEVTPAGEVVWEYISPFTVNRTAGAITGDVSCIFRAYRYDPGGPEIRGRAG